MNLKKISLALALAFSAALVYAGLTVATSVPAQASQPSVADVTELLTRLVNGRDARRSDLPTVRFVLDSTEDRAKRYPCGFNSSGNLLSERGDEHEAQMIGDVKYAHDARAKRSAEAKLSRHMGFCYLVDSTTVSGVAKNASAARSGAVKRVALALSKMSGGAVTVVNGNKRTVYSW